MVMEDNIYEETGNNGIEGENTSGKTRDIFEDNLPPAFMLNLPTYNVDILKEEIGKQSKANEDESVESKEFKAWLDGLQQKAKLKKIYGKFIRDHRLIFRAVEA